MSSFQNDGLKRLSLPMSAAWLLSDLAEFKGRLGLARAEIETLRPLLETAFVQSVESSNRIEGITVGAGRLRPLVLGQEKPRDRSEEEILGYRRALAWVQGEGRRAVIEPRLFLDLHAQVQAGAGDAGQWKRVDNEIVELREGLAPRVRFRPTPAAQTPGAISELCDLFERSVARAEVPHLVSIAALLLDFLCIHPFRDGNGRVSRLVTYLVLTRFGHEVGRYVSLERLIEEARDDYYESLRLSSEKWHEGRHDLLPWLHFCLAILRRAYTEFEASAAIEPSEAIGPNNRRAGNKTAQLESAIAAFQGAFTIVDLLGACPTTSRELARKVLRKLSDQGKVENLGKGPGAQWRRL